jgi:hypothetical protein
MTSVSHFVCSGDVDIWVNGGWEQPGCGFAVVPRHLLQHGVDNVTDGKNCIVKFNQIIM